MGECRDCAYSDRPTYKWPCCSCRDTNNGRSMYCQEEGEQCSQLQKKEECKMNDNDFIRRKAAINAELRIKVDIPPYKTRTIKAAEGAVERAVTAYAEYINAIPAADVRPVVHGEWVPSTNPDLYGYLMCSVCKKAFFLPSAQPHEGQFRFCHNCGAEMTK